MPDGRSGHIYNFYYLDHDEDQEGAGALIYLLCFILFGVGIYGLLVKKNIIKLILSLMISSYAINLFFIASGFRWHGRTPVLDARITQDIIMVDPLPQAVVLISIIVGAAFTALLCVVAMRLYQQFGTFDIIKIKEIIRGTKDK